MAKTPSLTNPHLSKEYAFRLYQFEGAEQVDGALVRDFATQDYAGYNSINIHLYDKENINLMGFRSRIEGMPENISGFVKSSSVSELPFIGERPYKWTQDAVWNKAVYGEDMIMYLPMPKKNEVNVVWEFGTFNFSVSPRVINGTTMVPAKDFFETFEFFADDLNEENTILLSKRGVEVYLETGSKEVKVINNASVGGHYKIPLTESIQEIDGVVFVPVRFAAELAGVNLKWYPDNRTISLTEVGTYFPNLGPYEEFIVAD